MEDTVRGELSGGTDLAVQSSIREQLNKLQEDLEQMASATYLAGTQAGD